MQSELVLHNEKSVQAAVKRFLDILAALLGLLLLLPLLALIGILIKVSSPGNVLFKQVRVGKDGKPFEMYKFRTMQSGSGEDIQEYLKGDPRLHLEYEQLQKLIHDPRFTSVGRTLRRSSLDELPQLWNILKGEMSVVGPRPFLPEQQKMYGSGVLFYESVRPGLTGLWQVSGRNQLSFAERVEYDIQYVTTWSIWLDLIILVRTPWVVVRQRGAY